LDDLYDGSEVFGVGIIIPAGLSLLTRKP